MSESDSPPLSPARSPRESKISVARMVESIVGCKWSVRLLDTVAQGTCRPSALLRACPGLSAKVMYERLGKMTRFGILDRKVFGNKPPVEVEYHLTPLGHRFMGILSEIRRLQESLERGEIARADTDAPRDDGQADLYGAPS